MTNNIKVMININKIYAIILDRNQGGLGEGGNCKVVAFVRDKDYVDDKKNYVNYHG